MFGAYVEFFLYGRAVLDRHFTMGETACGAHSDTVSAPDTYLLCFGGRRRIVAPFKIDNSGRADGGADAVLAAGLLIYFK